MNTAEALAILDQATGQLAATRADHMKIAEAFNTLRAFVNDNTDSDEGIKPEPA